MEGFMTTRPDIIGKLMDDAQKQLQQRIVEVAPAIAGSLQVCVLCWWYDTPNIVAMAQSSDMPEDRVAPNLRELASQFESELAGRQIISPSP
jgi:hypothetical protein